MTPDGVCKALLSHLCVLVQQSSFLIHMDAQPPLLTALAIQLGVLQPKVLQPYVANFLVSLLSDGGMGRLYLDILKESTDLQKVSHSRFAFAATGSRVLTTVPWEPWPAVELLTPFSSLHAAQHTAAFVLVLQQEWNGPVIGSEQTDN